MGKNVTKKMKIDQYPTILCLFSKGTISYGSGGCLNPTRKIMTAHTHHPGHKNPSELTKTKRFLPLKGDISEIRHK